MRRAVTPEQLVRWFSATAAPDRPTYEESLLEKVSRDEIAAYRRAFEEQLLGRTLNRPVPGVVLKAWKR